VEIQVVFWSKTPNCINVGRAGSISFLTTRCVCSTARHNVRRPTWTRCDLLFRLPCVVRHCVVICRRSGQGERLLPKQLMSGLGKQYAKLFSLDCSCNWWERSGAVRWTWCGKARKLSMMPVAAEGTATCGLKINLPKAAIAQRGPRESASRARYAIATLNTTLHTTCAANASKRTFFRPSLVQMIP
jgi:hypothetical protein